LLQLNKNVKRIIGIGVIIFIVKWVLIYSAWSM
jgi:hypothetical protein